MYMLFGLLTLFTALAIAGVAAWFSIVGLMTFFQGAALSIAIMAGTLEIGKLVTVSWLYRYWSETSILVKTYLSIAVIFLMLITSIGIFGYLSKAHQEVSGSSSDAFAIVERLDGQVLREENKINILEDRIASLQTGGGLDVSSSIQQQVAIRDGAWDRVQGDIDYAQGQIQSIRDQLVIDLEAQDSRLIPLDNIVDSYASQGTVTTETDAGGIFRSAETETVDNVAKANEVRLTQKEERDAIADEKNRLRRTAQTDINSQQGNIDNYRAQAQTTIQSADNEINNLRESSSANQDDSLGKIDDYNEQIDTIYDGIIIIKDERFIAQQVVRDLEKEIGPIKYVAELVYGESGEEVLDQAIRLFIILLVVVFDPLAIMLLLAANQTLLRFGINLEDKGPEPHFVNEIIDPSDDIINTYDQMATSISNPDDKNQKKRIRDLEKQLAKKPKTVEVIKEVPIEIIVEKEVLVEVEKEVIVEKIVEVPVEVPVEVIKEVIVTKEIEVEKVVEKIVEKPVEIEKEVVVTKEVPLWKERIVEVPGPERIVEVPGPERVIEKIVEVPVTEFVETSPEVIEKESSKDLHEAARLMAQSEWNKEDFTEKQIFDMINKESEDEVKKKIGFWAMPLPKNDEPEPTNKKYTGKKR